MCMEHNDTTPNPITLQLPPISLVPTKQTQLNKEGDFYPHWMQWVLQCLAMKARQLAGDALR